MSSSGKNPLFETIATQGKRIFALTTERNRLQKLVDKSTANQDPERNFALWKEVEALAETRRARIAELDAKILELQESVRVEHEARVAAEGQVVKSLGLLEEQGRVLNEANDKTETFARQAEEFSKRLAHKRVVSKVQRVFEIAALVLVVPALLLVLILMGVGNEVRDAKMRAAFAVDRQQKAEFDLRNIASDQNSAYGKMESYQANIKKLEGIVEEYKKPKTGLVDPHIGVMIRSSTGSPQASLTLSEIYSVPTTGPSAELSEERTLLREFMNNTVLATAHALIMIDLDPGEHPFHYSDDGEGTLSIFLHKKSKTRMSFSQALNDVFGETGLAYIAERCTVEYTLDVRILASGLYGTVCEVKFDPTKKKFVEMRFKG